MNEMTMPTQDGGQPGGSSKRLAIWISVILGVLLVGLIGWWWWSNRPIQPVVLSPAEKQVVEAKVEALQGESGADGGGPPSDGPVYEKGGKEIVLTERELNGLLNENTALGKSLKFELARDAVHARVEMDLDPSLPVLGGRKLKAKARLLVADVAGKPSLVLDDVTVWGISLPNEWLGGMKGHDLFGQVLGTKGGGLPGVESFSVEPGQLKMKLSE